VRSTPIILCFFDLPFAFFGAVFLRSNLHFYGLIEFTQYFVFAREFALSAFVLTPLFVLHCVFRTIHFYAVYFAALFAFSFGLVARCFCGWL
jgi:hypothetical protein